mmetsp:Transcript_4529/g.8050  ORF Transcript_4529/g.8050 Transcript_4529/m.8050 type:complete len:95 (-) Transcript_4529:424-708(-)
MVTVAVVVVVTVVGTLVVVTAVILVVVVGVGIDIDVVSVVVIVVVDIVAGIVYNCYFKNLFAGQISNLFFSFLVYTCRCTTNIKVSPPMAATNL